MIEFFMLIIVNFLGNGAFLREIFETKVVGFREEQQCGVICTEKPLSLKKEGWKPSLTAPLTIILILNTNLYFLHIFKELFKSFPDP